MVAGTLGVVVRAVGVGLSITGVVVGAVVVVVSAVGVVVGGTAGGSRYSRGNGTCCSGSNKCCSGSGKCYRGGGTCCLDPVSPVQNSKKKFQTFTGGCVSRCAEQNTLHSVPGSENENSTSYSDLRVFNVKY